MNSRERVIAALQRRVPDRVPFFECVIDERVMQALLPEADYYEFNEWIGLDVASQNRGCSGGGVFRGHEPILILWGRFDITQTAIISSCPRNPPAILGSARASERRAQPRAIVRLLLPRIEKTGLPVLCT